MDIKGGAGWDELEDWAWHIHTTMYKMVFPDGSNSKRIHLQCRRPGFYPWVGKILWRRERQLTPVFLFEEFQGQRSLVGYIQSMRSQRVRHNWETSTHTLIKQITRTYGISQGTPVNALWQPIYQRRKGNKKRGRKFKKEGLHYKHYSWLTLLYSRNEHSTLNQL